MPPLELISCGAVARDWQAMDVVLIDAIAEKLSIEETIERIKSFAPDMIYTLSGFECFDEDMDAIRSIKSAIPDSIYILFGYLATMFPYEALQHSDADYLILGEPELVLKDLLQALIKNEEIEDVNAIAYLKEGQLVTKGESGRIRDPNELPIPAYDLLPTGKYYEPLLARPYGMIQTIRGCSYKCNYCVKSYGTKLSQLSTERVLAEIKLWIDLQQVRSIRFIDDTFTINRRRVIDLCQAMIRENIRIEWACLSRTDNLDPEMLAWMKKAGCKRIYFGMESGSQRMLNIYKKNVKVEDALRAFQECRNAGIETAAFFMTGHPAETEEDFEETMAFAKAANLNYASYNPLKPYPGTGMYEEVKEAVDFSVYPYKNEWKDPSIGRDYDRRKQLFYKSFYIRMGFFTNNFGVMLRNTGQIIVMGTKMLRYLWWDQKFIIGGRRTWRDN